ncbi:hypothetical protein ACFVXC_27040 [Streptomyces sp. NPDC058257]|uniref:hypothetical protein n=1 Tax=Streptomyces sp. NPDC058257 TaxID=3346409 RepID=UPI0036EFAB8D
MPLLTAALCAVAPSLGWLVALRFVAGFSGVAGVVISRAVVADRLQGAAAARLFGVTRGGRTRTGRPSF